MQTALQELDEIIEFLSQVLPMNNERNKAIIDTYAHCCSIIKSYLEKEKDQIETAFKEGYKECLDTKVHGMNDIYSDVEGKDYYKKTFKND